MAHRGAGNLGEIHRPLDSSRQRDLWLQCADLEHETIRKREEFEQQTGPTLELSQDEIAEAEAARAEAEERGEIYVQPPGRNPVRNRLLEQETRYPLERMREIEQQKAEARAKARAEAGKAGDRYFVQAPALGDEGAAMQLLTELVDEMIKKDVLKELEKKAVAS